MSFKNYLTEEFTIKTPKPDKREVLVNLKEYKELIENSNLSHDRKELMKKIVEVSGEIPVFCENTHKFCMCDLNNKKKKTREVKSREDKEACGVLLNSMIIKEHKAGNTQKELFLKNMRLGWEVPPVVFSVK